MVTLQAVKAGVQKYLEEELIAKISGWQKWIVGAALSMGIDKADAMYESLKNNDLIKMLNVIDDNGLIDIDAVYEKLMEQASKSTASFTVPMLDTITLNVTDVEKIYKCIKMYT